ncbi:hypothetical protein EVAR_6058_1 [Eumeta japonica]|uniref:Uncharacterized protein n=1 Tax=Eumeta variegata TaxID=151549 RepID=A0A4C1T9P7_EUMVA|nr:hypothetical protein EVAR_6058_1 [Eumeta japonica]
MVVKMGRLDQNITLAKDYTLTVHAREVAAFAVAFRPDIGDGIVENYPPPSDIFLSCYSPPFSSFPLFAVGARKLAPYRCWI